MTGGVTEPETQPFRCRQRLYRQRKRNASDGRRHAQYPCRPSYTPSPDGAFSRILPYPDFLLPMSCRIPPFSPTISVLPSFPLFAQNQTLLHTVVHILMLLPNANAHPLSYEKKFRVSQKPLCHPNGFYCFASNRFFKVTQGLHQNAIKVASELHHFEIFRKNSFIPS